MAAAGSVKQVPERPVYKATAVGSVSHTARTQLIHCPACPPGGSSGGVLASPQNSASTSIPSPFCAVVVAGKPPSAARLMLPAVIRFKYRLRLTLRHSWLSSLIVQIVSQPVT